jgi:hypothetical protein
LVGTEEREAAEGLGEEADPGVGEEEREAGPAVDLEGEVGPEEAGVV